VSNQARLLLLSGTGGSGTTSACAATVAALEDEGLTAIGLDPYGQDGELQNVGATLTALLRLPVEPPVEWWGDLSPLRHLAAWRRILAVSAAPVDAVVVDAGELHRAVALVDAPQSMARVLDSLLTPDLASRSAEEDPESAYARLSAARDTLADAARLLVDDRTSMRLVAEAREHSVDAVLRAAGILAMLGVDVDGIIVNRCLRKSDDASSTALRLQRELMAAVQARADGPLVWKSTDEVRAAPKGRSAMGPLGRSRVLRSDTLSVEAGEEGFVLRVPLGREVAQRARVGRYADSMVVRCDDATRWIELPSVLRRCLAIEASRTTDGMRVDFVPDPQQWRGDARAAGAA
jgi:arsenite-transporting ATPase